MRLEQLSWLAAVVGVIWAVWAHYHPSSQAIPLANVTGNGVVVQGNNNTILPQAQKDTIERNISVRDAKIQTGKARYDVHYPVISGMQNNNIQDKVNFLIKRTAIGTYETCDFCTEVDVKYKVTFTEFNLLGIDFFGSVYASGAAHAIYGSTPLIVNLETGDAFELKDLFRSSYKVKMNEVIVNLLKTDDNYFPCTSPKDNSGCFSSVRDDEHFYLTDTSLIINFPQYQVAPGVKGVVDIRISYDDLKKLEIINPNGPLRRFL